MLRAKQLSNLSRTARSFFLNGSRCAADGSSCTCSEDENYVPIRQDARNSNMLAHKPFTLVSNIPVRVDTPVSSDTNGAALSKNPSAYISKTVARAENSVAGDAIKLLGTQQDKSILPPTALPQVVPIPNAFEEL